jgi:hypothetical protein
MRNRFYVGEQPDKSILSLVVIDEIPLSEEAHVRLGELREVSDLLFILPEKHRMGILAQKFGSLYQACCWVESEGELGEAMMESLEYDKEIFGSHVLVLITHASNITDLKGEKLQKIAASALSKPIYQTRRLTSQEFYAIYKDGRDRPNWMNRYLPTSLNHKFNLSPDLSNLYTTHTVTSKETLLRPAVIGKMLEFWKSERDDGFSGEGYVCSFCQPSLNYILASMLKRLKQGELEVNVDDL